MRAWSHRRWFGQDDSRIQSPSSHDINAVGVEEMELHAMGSVAVSQLGAGQAPEAAVWLAVRTLCCGEPTM